MPDSSPPAPLGDAATPWWVDLYDDAAADLFLSHEDAGLRARIVDFLWRTLALAPGQTVFDQCCGTGVLAVALAARGVGVVGVDQSGPYIARARELAARQPGPPQVSFVHADAFTHVPAVPCDGAFNWATGFGNAASDADNARMLARAHAALRSGAFYVLDVQNVPRILSAFQPVLVRRGRLAGGGEVLLLRESTLDYAAGCLRQVWTYLLPGGERRVRHSAVRLYLPHAIADLLRGCGFVDVSLIGDLDGAPFDTASPRLLVRARKP